MKQLFLILIALLWICSSLIAQTNPTPHHYEPYQLQSDIYENKSQSQTGDYLAFQQIIKIPEAPWIRIFFNTLNLGTNSYVVLQSVKDGSSQRLDALRMEQWRNSTAYFNGEAVEFKLYVAPGDQNIFFDVSEVMVGEVSNNPLESICGNDDRVASAHPAIGRIIPVGCTGWIANTGLHVSAGHCLNGNHGAADILEFNIPPSLPDGTY